RAGAPGPRRVENGASFAVLTQPGPFALSLDWASEVTAEPGRAGFSLAAPPAGTVRATFDLPGPDLDVRLSPGRVLRRSTAAGRTVVAAALDAGTPCPVSWPWGE